MATETLQLDSLQLARWRADNDYDYDRELAGGGQSIMEWLSEKVSRWLNRLFDQTFDSNAVYYALVALGAAAVLLVLWLVWKHHPGLFKRSGSHQQAPLTATDEDTIYGIDFEAELQRALARADYRQAVRYVYLQTLAWLSEQKRIDWQPQKTPTQYVREVGDGPFRELSRHFVRVRYGNFDATEALVRQLQALQAEVQGQQKGGEAS
ncbi:MAG: DUF4129 domain-containing protein [Prevotella sp.]|nr:DUF4129 domain-containing protein [Prevotella sp.]